jgi:AhpD family alkylhydroperoxidase
MTPFPVLDAKSAPTRGARALLRQLQRRRGFVTNLNGALAASEVALRVYGEMARQYQQTSLTPAERLVVSLTASRLNQAAYCVAGHSAVAEATGMTRELIRALRRGAALADARLEALRRFTEAAYHGRGAVDEAAWRDFEAAGYQRPQALEVLVGIALKHFSHCASRMTEVTLDEGFRPWSWNDAS